MAKIFISYRRDDSRWPTGRIYDRLKDRFGAENVFVDVDSIPLGVDFREHLDGKIEACDLVLAVIGSGWLSLEDADGQRRLDSPRDYVRTEIELALQRKIPVVPVLLDGVRMPAEGDLPPSIAKLAYRNAQKLDSDSFSAHMDSLVRGLERLLGTTASPVQPDPAALVTARDVGETPEPTAGSGEPVPVPEPTADAAPGRGRTETRSQPSVDAQVQMLVDELDDPGTKPERRLKIGDRLAVLGDPRPGVGLDANGLPDIDWVEVPEGDFLFGVQKEREFSPAFRIARYPVTNAQFQAFIDHGGYEADRWWKGLGQRLHTRWTDSNWTQPNRPLDSVAWLEAVVFCRWLSERRDEDIRLPTEIEWEKAARGTDGREYPWGDGYRSGWANLDEPVWMGMIGLGFLKKSSYYLAQTSAAGVYPQGASPCGALDMAGNVWEICTNEYDGPENTATEGAVGDVVLRGGSWREDRVKARADYRDGPLKKLCPDHGFRVLCSSPISR